MSTETTTNVTVGTPTTESDTSSNKPELKKEYKRMLDGILTVYIDSGYSSPEFRAIFAQLDPDLWKEIEAYSSYLGTTVKAKKERAVQRSLDSLLAKLTPDQLTDLKNKLNTPV